jgi:hypothetical protein
LQTPVGGKKRNVASQNKARCEEMASKISSSDAQFIIPFRSGIQYACLPYLLIK